jgi:hypothetical protein
MKNKNDCQRDQLGDCMWRSRMVHIDLGLDLYLVWCPAQTGLLIIQNSDVVFTVLGEDERIKTRWQTSRSKRTVAEAAAHNDWSIFSVNHGKQIFLFGGGGRGVGKSEKNLYLHSSSETKKHLLLMYFFVRNFDYLFSKYAMKMAKRVLWKRNYLSFTLYQIFPKSFYTVCKSCYVRSVG